MPKIKIHRKKDWTIRSKVFEVFVDGTRIGYLSNGETNEYDVPAGQHKIKVKMGRFGSNNFECNIFNKDSKSFIVSFNSIAIIVGIVLMTGVLFLGMFLMKMHKGERIYSWFFTAFIAVFAIYWQTVGRNTYLILKEEI
jgi:hypothetical protein